MNLKIELNLWFDGMDECTDEEIRNCLATILGIGAESTCSDIDIILVENESGTI